MKHITTYSKEPEALTRKKKDTLHGADVYVQLGLEKFYASETETEKTHYSGKCFKINILSLWFIP